MSLCRALSESCTLCDLRIIAINYRSYGALFMIHPPYRLWGPIRYSPSGAVELKQWYYTGSDTLLAASQAWPKPLKPFGFGVMEIFDPRFLATVQHPPNAN